MDCCLKCCTSIIVGAQNLYDRMPCLIKSHQLVEPIIFVYMLCVFLQYPAVQALCYLKICSENYNKTICSNLSAYKSEENQVQKDTSEWILYINLALLVPSIFSSILLGRIGDMVSRKLTILLPITGMFFCSITYLVNTLYIDISLSYILIAPLVNGLFGGFTSLMMGIYSYVGHTTQVKSRTIRMGILEAMTFLSGTLGVLLVGTLLDHFGFVTVFAIIFTLTCVALVYTIFVIEDIVPENVSSKIDVFRQVFSKEGCRDFVMVFRKTREGNQNIILILGTIIICILMFITAGDIDLSLLYLLHPPLSFSKSYISYYLGWDNCMKALPLIILLPLFKRFFAISDYFWAILGILSKSLGCVLFGTSHVTWLIFCVPLVKMFQGFPSAVMRSLLSSIVENTEQGQLFAVVACAESILTLLASVVLNTLYSATVNINPGISFYVSAGIGLIGTILIGIVWKLSRNSFKYEHFVEVPENTETSDDIVES